MIKLLVRMIFSTIAGLCCCCVVESEAPQSLLRDYIESQASPDNATLNKKPKLDVVFANATLAMLSGESILNIESIAKAELLNSSQQRIDDVFSSDIPDNPDQKLQPVDVQSTIQSNRFLIAQ